MIVGICGDICSGKTTVSRELEKCGARVFYADNVVKELYKKKYIKKKLFALFGADIFQTSNKKDNEQTATIANSSEIDRKKLAKIIFSNKRLKKKLESIIHPLVRKKMNSFIKKHRKKIIVLDIPLLFEKGLNSICDKIIFVKSPYRQILKRLKSKNITISDYRNRKKNQIDSKIKLKLSNYIIYNTRTLKYLKSECKKIFRELRGETR